jgi:hypothetical protein
MLSRAKEHKVLVSRGRTHSSRNAKVCISFDNFMAPLVVVGGDMLHGCFIFYMSSPSMLVI